MRCRLYLYSCKLRVFGHCRRTCLGIFLDNQVRCVWSRTGSAINFLGVVMKRVIEIRSAEGGEDSKLFVVDLAQAYQRHFSRVG